MSLSFVGKGHDMGTSGPLLLWKHRKEHPGRIKAHTQTISLSLSLFPLYKNNWTTELSRLCDNIILWYYLICSVWSESSAQSWKRHPGVMRSASVHHADWGSIPPGTIHETATRWSCRAAWYRNASFPKLVLPAESRQKAYLLWEGTKIFSSIYIWKKNQQWACALCLKIYQWPKQFLWLFISDLVGTESVKLMKPGHRAYVGAWRRINAYIK